MVINHKIQADFSADHPNFFREHSVVKTGRPSKHSRTPFGERLHAARIAAGLSQAQLAERLGITQTSYAAWERHTLALRPEQIEQVTEILGISPNYLFGKTKKAVSNKAAAKK
jgi:ribosome-binding protein aMBF1 (putative translation factor)